MDIQHLVRGLAIGDVASQNAFYKEFVNETLRTARNILKGTPRSDPSMVALSVMRRFFDQAEKHPERMVRMTREDIQALLHRIVLNRALTERVKVLAQRRHPVRVINDEELLYSRAFLEEFAEAGADLARRVLIDGAQLPNVCQELGITIGDVEQRLRPIIAWLERARQTPERVLSISDCVHESEIAEDLLADHSRPEIEAVVREFLQSLGAQTQTIVKMRYSGYNLKEIGTAVGMSPCAARHRLKDVFKHWKSHDR